MIESVNKGDLAETARSLELIKFFQEAQTNFNASLPQLSMEIAVIKATNAFGKGQVTAPKMEAAAPKPVEAAPVEKKSEKVVVEPAAKPEITSNAPIDLKLEEVVAQWPRVMERIKHPSLRMSIRNAKPVALEDVLLTLQFSSNFHEVKVMDHDNRIELEGILDEICGHPFKLKSEVKELELKSLVEEDIAEEPPMEATPDHSSAEKALDIFGGEFVN